MIGALFCTSAFAQDVEGPRYDRALAAGYKAQFLCSGLWNGGKSLEDIEADELTGSYERVETVISELTADIDNVAREVRVPFADDLPPRVAIWNSRSGCTAMPIGYEPTKRVESTERRAFFDDRSWPMGDRGALIKPLQRSRALQSVARRAFQPEVYGGKTSAALVVKNGRIYAEHYKQGHDLHTAQRSWSVAKSVSGTLIGHSVLQNVVDVTASAGLPPWQHADDPRNAITIEHLLRMASGLTSDTSGARTDAIYLGGSSVAEKAASWPLLHRPDTSFRYANNDTLLAVLATRLQHLRKQRDESGTPGFDPYGFFQKLGMTRTYAERDWQGNYILSSQLWSTARDFGRLGMLYLNNGMWNGERLLPEDWRKFVTTASGPQPSRGFGYGATFWLLNKSEGIPEDAFAAIGNRGQYLVIIPSLDLVIVRRGYDSGDSRFKIEDFVRDVIGALAP
tara:strand:+ start:70058 stop:71416 length:1359 start_codon:yes stop_codon:yes gene_type:complete